MVRGLKNETGFSAPARARFFVGGFELGFGDLAHDSGCASKQLAADRITSTASEPGACRAGAPIRDRLCRSAAID